MLSFQYNAIVRSQMVLQQNKNTALYGFSKVAGSTVSVAFDGGVYSTVASSTVSADGGYFWKVTVPPRAGSFGKYSMNVTSSAGEIAELNNVVFGDVFLCSGQSNMQMGVPGKKENELLAVDSKNKCFRYV
jgi:sialate O-acetylesterase